MPLKILLLAFSLHAHAAVDTVPALHNIREEDVDTAIASWKDKTITVKLKNGTSYFYTREQWRKEMTPDIQLGPKLGHATFVLDATFTRVEHPATFPGGDSAWQEYQQKLFTEHYRLIRKQGPATVWVQFIVAFDGEIDNVELMGNAPDKLGDLAIRMIKEGPNWVPANQNGHNVTSYARQKIEFK